MSTRDQGAPLSRSQCRRFRHEGHLQVSGLDSAVLSAARAASQALWERGSGTFGRCVVECGRESRGLDRAFNAQTEVVPLARILHGSGLGRRAAQLLGCASVRLWYTQLIAKHPVSAQSTILAGAVGWHQDYAYWQCCYPADLLTAWIPLQAVSRDSGALAVLTGSHLLRVEEPLKGFNKEIDYKEHLRASGGAHGVFEELVELELGQFSYHHCMTLHSSAPNRTGSPRLAFVVHLMDADVRLRSGTPCHHSLESLWPGGLPVRTFPGDGEHWPIID